MSITLDRQYINRISYKLPLFKWKSDRVANFRCVICGDSKRNAVATRGYLLNKKEYFQYFCHNCGTSLRFSSFLKHFEPVLYSEYSLEYFKDKKSDNVKKEVDVAKFMEPVVFSTSDDFKHATKLSKLTKDHFALLYFESRKLPAKYLDKLLYCDNLRSFINDDLCIDKVVPESQYLVIPYYREGKFVGISARSLGSEPKYRYIKIRSNGDIRLIYGIDDLNKSHPVYVTEGEFDSMFVENAIAAGSVSALMGIEQQIGVERNSVTIVCDKDQRNREVLKTISRLINNDYTVVLWPDEFEGKDINDFVRKYGWSNTELMEMIRKYTFTGIAARLEFMNWKKYEIS